MKLIQLQYFLAVVEYGSISSAAKALKMSQSALSTALCNLEREAGQPLFLRQRKGLLLTETGEAILPTVRHIFESIAKIDSLKQQQRPFQLAGTSEAMPLLYDYNRAFHANIAELDRQTPLTENKFEQWDGLFLNESHASFLQHCAQKNSCTILLLAHAKPMLYLSSTHPLAEYDQIPLQSLSEQRLLIPVDHQLLFPDSWLSENHVTYFEDINTAKMITAERQGCAILPPYLFAHDFYIAQGLTKLVEITDDLAEAQLYLAMSNRRLTDLMQHELGQWFIACLQAPSGKEQCL